MCYQVTEHLFHNYGHIQRTKTLTSNPECFQEIHDVVYHGDKYCALCIWGRFEPECYFSNVLSVRCNGHQGKLKTITQHNADRWIATTKDDLWARRKQLVGRYNLWQGEILGDKFQEEYTKIRKDEISRRVPPQHQLYYLGPGQFNKNFLTALNPADIPVERENCFCGFSVKVQGEEGCEGGGPCTLPCGHIFGYDCVLRWIKDENSNRCPQCSSFMRIFRVDAQFGYPEEFQEHIKYDNDPNVWQNNLRSLLNSLLIYMILLQFLFICPMPPWTDPNMICLATLWIPINLLEESGVFQFHRSLIFARVMEVIDFIFPKRVRVLLVVQQLYWHRERIFQDVSPS